MNVIFLLGWCNYKSKVDTYPSICGAAYSSKLCVKCNVAIGWEGHLWWGVAFSISPLSNVLSAGGGAQNAHAQARA